MRELIDLLKGDSDTVRASYQLIDFDSNTIEVEGQKSALSNAYYNRGATLWLIHGFVSQALATDEPGFKIGDGSRYSELPLGRYFGSLRTFVGKIPDDPNLIHHDQVGLFVDCAREMGLFIHRWTHLRTYYRQGKTGAELFNDFLDRLRQKAASATYKRSMLMRSHNAHRNFRSMANYMDALFRKHSTLLVLRMDFGYCQEEARRITCEQALEDFSRLLNNRRANKLFRDLKGHIRKLEYGPDKKWCFHAIFFFEAGKVGEGATLASLIGKYWSENITQGNGTFFNCSASSNPYKRSGIGEIHAADSVKRTQLTHAISYLTRKDALLGLRTPRDCHTITRGEMPKAPAAPKGTGHKHPSNSRTRKPL